MDKIFFYQPVKSDMRIFDNIRKIATGQGDDYTTGCLLDYPNFKDHHKMIAKDLSKQNHLMLIQNQYTKLILLEIYTEEGVQQFFFSLLKR